MQINLEDQQAEVEQSDISKYLTSFLPGYLFYAKNEAPKVIVVPMITSVEHPHKEEGKPKKPDIPVVWIPADSELSISRKEDAADIPDTNERTAETMENMASAAQEATKPPAESLSTQPEDKPPDLALSASEDKSREELAQAEAAVKKSEEAVSAAKKALAELEKNKPVDRQPRQPTNPIPPGSGISPDDMHSRDQSMQKLVAKDIAPQKEVDESAEIETDIRGKDESTK
jgi:hypothetical protein